MYMKNEMSRGEFTEDMRDKDKDIIDPLKDQINDTLRIAYLELAIYHFYDMFIKYCEKVVEKIKVVKSSVDNPLDSIYTASKIQKEYSKLQYIFLYSLPQVHGTV